jgi:hypothetical protein
VDAHHAIAQCDTDRFRRAMHRLQDYPFHRAKGYEWKPWRFWKPRTSYGHLVDSAVWGINPDNDFSAWQWANKMTRLMVKKWDISECCAIGEANEK